MSIIQLMNRIDANVVSLTMLCIVVVMVAIGDDRATLRFRLFLGLLVLTVVELVLDMLTWGLDGQPGSGIPLYLVHTLYFFIQPLATYLWTLYADYQTFFDGKRLKRLALVLSLPVIAHSVMVLASPATGWIFMIDSANVYSRGRLFIVAAVIPFLYLGYGLLATLLHWSRIPQRSRFPLLLFAVPPMLGGVVQSLFFGVTLLWPGVALSLLMVYLSIESDLLITDHLTGLHNRRSLYRYLARKLRFAPADRFFTVIMLDLDGFKRINDSFGHAQGDEALAETAGVLKRCLHANDFIARYAGDEFVVIADIHRREDADTLRARIGESFAAFNRVSGKSWQLAASMGAAIREPGDGKTYEVLLAEADALMYKDKL